ncbi:MAG: glycine cleavage system protein GcvH [Clostridia bacterium]|jgi:glycine cleavage system H protein|nr:glycine cleavage system protein GcvH [Clostridia bacterium]
MYPVDLKYSKDHEWIRVDGKEVTIGITFHAQEAMGDVVFVELPEVGDSFESGESFANIESVKAVSDCYAPFGGTVTAVNEALEDSPELINTDPYGDGWIIKMETGDLSVLDGLMSAQEYQEFLKEEE